MSEERIVTPTGFLRVLISLDKNLENEELAFTFSAIEITQPDLFPSAAKRIPVNIGQRQIIALRAGLYRVRALLGSMSSDFANTEIKTGEITSKIFHFGSESK
jgi:hypothetical protein